MMDDNHTRGTTMHITKESLASMSLEELRAERAQQRALIVGAYAIIELCKQEIIKKLAEFTVGDRVTDKNGARWEITGMDVTDWGTEDRVKYFGKRLKKDGTPGIVNYEIYHKPIQLTLSEENVHE